MISGAILEMPARLSLTERYSMLKSIIFSCEPELMKLFCRDGTLRRKEKENITYNRLLVLNPSMIFRFKRLQNKFDGEELLKKTANMIAINNPKTINITGEGKRHHLPFSTNDFIKKAAGKWTDDFIDSLLILYQYNYLQSVYSHFKTTQ